MAAGSENCPRDETRYTLVLPSCNDSILQEIPAIRNGRTRTRTQRSVAVLLRIVSDVRGMGLQSGSMTSVFPHYFGHPSEPNRRCISQKAAAARPIVGKVVAGVPTGRAPRTSPTIEGSARDTARNHPHIAGSVRDVPVGLREEVCARTTLVEGRRSAFSTARHANAPERSGDPRVWFDHCSCRPSLLESLKRRTCQRP